MELVSSQGNWTTEEWKAALEADLKKFEEYGEVKWWMKAARRLCNYFLYTNPDLVFEVSKSFYEKMKAFVNNSVSYDITERDGAYYVRRTCPIIPRE